MDVGGASGRSQSKALVEFRAGKMNLNATNKMVTADKRKGLVSVYQSDDQRMHFTWKVRLTFSLIKLLEKYCCSGSWHRNSRG